MPGRHGTMSDRRPPATAPLRGRMRGCRYHCRCSLSCSSAWLGRNADHLPGLQRRPQAPEAEGHRGDIAADMEPLDDGERGRIDVNHAVVLRRFVFPDSGGARPDRASPNRRVDGPDGQPPDAPDRGGLGISLQQPTAVRVGHRGAAPWSCMEQPMPASWAAAKAMKDSDRMELYLTDLFPEEEVDGVMSSAFDHPECGWRWRCRSDSIRI